MEMKTEKELCIKLREDLKRAEIERLRILNRLNELEQKRTSLELEKADMNVDLETKSRTFEQLQEDYRGILQSIASSQNEIDGLRATIIADEELIRSLRARIAGVLSEIATTNGKYRLIQDRYDTAVASYT